MANTKQQVEHKGKIIKVGDHFIIRRTKTEIVIGAIAVGLESTRPNTLQCLITLPNGKIIGAMTPNQVLTLCKKVGA